MSLVATSSLLFGIMILIRVKDKKVNIFAFLLFMTITVWAFGRAMMNVVDLKSTALFWTRFSYLGSVWMPYIFLLFCWSNLKVRVNKLVAYGLAVFFFILFFSVFTNNFIADLSPKLIFHFYESPGGYFYNVFSFSYTLVLIYSHIILFKFFNKAEGPIKTRVLYLMLASLIGFLPSSTTFPLVFDIPVYPFGVPIMILYPLVVFYAITKHELMDIRMAITKTVSYGIVITAIILSTVLAYLGLADLKVFQILAVMALSLFWAFTAIPLSNFLVTTAKRKFIRGQYESDKVINVLSEKISEEANRRTIISSIEDALSEAFELERTSIIVAVRDESNVLSHYILIDSETEASIQIEKDTALISFLSKSPGYVLFDSLEVDVQSILRKIGYKTNKQCILLPLSSPEILEGIIVLGKRSSQKAYVQKDYDFINQIKTFVSAILYKLTPYEKIEKKFLANQKKLHDAEVQILRSKKNESVGHVHRQFSHELRTPLNCIMHLTDSLDINPEQESIKKEIFEEIDNALDIVKETLRLSKTDELDERIECMIDINDAITASLKLMPASGYDVKQELSQLPQTLGVFRDIQMVFTNLMSNARDAMPEGGVVSIKTNLKGSDIYIEFSDTGCGIAADMKSKVWQPYISGNQTEFGNDSGGRGWGLTIVNRIIEEHQGHVSFISEEGDGTTFTIRLPIRS